MTAPIIIYRPMLQIQPLDENGDPDGADVDVTCDMVSVELSPDIPIDDVTTFCGAFQTVGEVVTSASLEVAVNADTNARWAALVGLQVEMRLWDRNDSTQYRKWTSQVPINPSLYGPTTPGEARTFSFDVPVTSAVEWATGAS